MYTLVFGLKSVLIAAAITPLAEAAVKFTTMPSYQTYVKNGSTAKLAWEYSDPNNDLMGIVFSVLVNGVFRRLLYKHNGVVKYHRNVPPAYKGRVSMEGNGTLVIKKVTPKDNTIFQCILLDSYSDIISTVRLIVAEAPKISLSSAHGICVVEGSFLNISCTASGKPEPDVTWIKNRIEISSGKKAALLIISRIRRTDDGLYTCRANNSIKIASQNRTLLVHYKPEGTRLLSSAPENSIEQSGKVTLTCTVTAAKPPVSQYRFIFNGTVVKHSNDNQYTISNVRRSLHYGEYKCVPSNTVGNGAEASMVLDVYDPPSIKDITTSARTSWINQTVTLKCVSDGNPTPTLTWYRPDGREVKAVRAKENKVHMLLKGDQDFGDYKCKAAYGLTPSDENKIKIRQIKKPGLASIISSQADIQASSLVAKWASPADDGGSPITAYRAILLKGDTEINRVNITNPDTTSYTFGDLERGTKYTVKVFTRNFVFEGDAAVRTLETKFVGPPAAPEVYNGPSETGKTTIILKWKEPENNGEQLTKYIVYQKVVNDGKRGSWKEIKVITDVSLRELEVHLKRGKVYEIAVTAINGYGESLKQNKANVKVLKETPGSTEFRLTVTLNETCGRRLIVAAKFPNVVCDLLVDHGCLAAFTEESRCGSVIVDFVMYFNQSVAANDVLTSLRNASLSDKFGGFKVDPGSFKQIYSPATQGPVECNCPSKEVMFTAITGALACFILLPIIYIAWLHTRGGARNKRTYEDEGGVYDNEIVLRDIEPRQPISSNLAQPPTEYMDLRETNRDHINTQNVGSGADYASLRPFTRAWEVLRDHVTIEKSIGNGAFCQVAKGTAVGLQGKPGTTTVAIKMLKLTAAESDRRDLMKELETMKQLKPHPHVIRLLGCVTESEPLLILIEYVPFGDLLGYLRKSRGLNDTYYKDPDFKPQTNLTSKQLVRFAWQIADGMSYLSSKNIIHRDLAARNVLVGQKETCKVTDFGMARSVEHENIYERKTKGRLPVKWTAYEALLYGTYTTKSDVWSYGVVLYEVFTIGGSPYPRMNGRKIANLLQKGYRMPKPQHVDDDLYQLMMRCWLNNPDERPTFTELKNQLKDMETLHKRLINTKMYDEQLYANVDDSVVK